MIAQSNKIEEDIRGKDTDLSWQSFLVFQDLQSFQIQYIIAYICQMDIQLDKQIIQSQFQVICQHMQLEIQVWKQFIVQNILSLKDIELDQYELYIYIIQNPWPWDEDKEAWNKKKIIVLKNWILNLFIGSSMCIVDSYFSEMQRSDLESYPTYFEMLQQIFLSIVMEDTIFYWIHRTLHHPKLYPLIHKKHHEFYTTVSISAEYAHPLEFALGNTFPVFAASKLLGARMHLVTVTTWLIIRIGETVDGHSGYEFSWSPYRLLPFSSSSEYHNYHHSHNIGNYESFFSFWDTICGTNQHFNKYRKEIEKEEQLQQMRAEYAEKQKSQ